MIALILRKNIRERIYYMKYIKYVNAQRKFDIKTFLYSYHYIFITMLLVLIIPITGYCFIFKENLLDYNTWISIILGVFSYLGTCLFGIFTFYFSWKQNIIEDNKLLPSISVNCVTDYKKNFFCLYSYNDIKDEIRKSFYSKNIHLKRRNEDFVYYYISLTNLSQIEIMDISPAYYVIISEYKFQKIFSFIAHSKEILPIDYKQNYDIYFGVDKQHIRKLGKNRKHQILKFVFSITDKFNKKYCVVCDCILGKTLGTNAYFVNYNLYMNEKNDFPEKVFPHYESFLN